MKFWISELLVALALFGTIYLMFLVAAVLRG